MKRWVARLSNVFIFTFCFALPVQSDSVVVHPGQNFILHIGQRAKLDDVFSVLFKAVIKDSRCPINVTCVWAGNGKVELVILDPEGSQQTIYLNTDLEPKVKSIQKYQLQLLSLNPPKVDGVKIAPEEYSVNLRMVKE